MGDFNFYAHSYVEVDRYCRSGGLSICNSSIKHKAAQRFEIPGASLEFEFISDEQNKVIKFQVIENGKMVEEAVKQQ